MLACLLRVAFERLPRRRNDREIEVPAFRFGQTTATRYTDVLVGPLDLGWHAKRADVTAGCQFYAPTGTYEFWGSDNTGKGMWTYEPFVGTTLLVDERKTVSLATTAYWELHGDKKDTNINVSQILTLQGGFGKSYLGGGVVFGAAYYAQWKLTADASVRTPCRVEEWKNCQFRSPQHQA